MSRLIFGSYAVLILDHLSLQDTAYREQARLIEHRASDALGRLEDFLYLAVGQDDKEFPFLIVPQHYAPGPGRYLLRVATKIVNIVQSPDVRSALLHKS